MMETVLGRISSISRRAIRASWLTPVARRSSSAVSPRSKPLKTLPSLVATAIGSKLRTRLALGNTIASSRSRSARIEPILVKSGPTLPPR